MSGVIARVDLQTSAAPPAFDGPLHITEITTAILDIPLIRPHRFAVTTIDKQSVVLVRVRTADGTEGIGEGVVAGGPWWGGESIEGVEILIKHYLAPLLIGQNAARIDYLMCFLNRAIAGGAYAKAAIEMALWDARGKSLGVPVVELLGGAHRTELDVTWALGAEPVEPVLDEIRLKFETGQHSSFKLKMGQLDPVEDVRRITAISQAVPTGVKLAVDLNGAWDERIAWRWLPALENAGITVIEQPVARWNHEALARLQQRACVSVMADESLSTVHDAVALARIRAANVFAQKLAKSGGICAVQRIAAVAEANGIACYGGTTIETSIGTAASAHVFCASASLTAGTELFGPLLLADDIVTNPVRYAAGALKLNNGPGFGVTIDEDKVQKYMRR